MLEVRMPDGSIHQIKSLLSKNNTKLDKSNKKSKKYLTYGLSLAPNTMSGYNTCQFASPGCIASCIFESGYARVFEKINRTRIAKTRLLFQDRPHFKSLLFKELETLNKAAKKQGKKLAVRLNVFSDLPWERIFPDLFTSFPKTQYYDYTKVPQRMLDYLDGKLPKNYHLTFSRSENNEEDCQKVIDKGGNVTVVFKSSRFKWPNNMPKEYLGEKTYNGDKTDLRFLDPKNRIVALSSKGLGAKDVTNFIIPLPMVNQ